MSKKPGAAGFSTACDLKHRWCGALSQSVNEPKILVLFREKPFCTGSACKCATVAKRLNSQWFGEFISSNHWEFISPNHYQKRPTGQEPPLSKTAMLFSLNRNPDFTVIIFVPGSLRILCRVIVHLYAVTCCDFVFFAVRQPF